MSDAPEAPKKYKTFRTPLYEPQRSIFRNWLIKEVGISEQDAQAEELLLEEGWQPYWDEHKKKFEAYREKEQEEEESEKEPLPEDPPISPKMSEITDQNERDQKAMKKGCFDPSYFNGD